MSEHKYITLFLGAVIVMPFSIALADEAELAIGDEYVALKYNRDLDSDFSFVFDFNTAERKNIDSDRFSFKLEAEGEVDYTDVALGIAVFNQSVESSDGYGVALGLKVGTQVVGNFSASASLYYSPDILTGGDLEDTIDLELKGKYQIIENASLFIGYKKMEADTDVDSIDLYSDYFFGASFNF